MRGLSFPEDEAAERGSTCEFTAAVAGGIRLGSVDPKSLPYTLFLLGRVFLDGVC